MSADGGSAHGMRSDESKESMDLSSNIVSHEMKAMVMSAKEFGIPVHVERAGKYLDVRYLIGVCEMSTNSLQPMQTVYRDQIQIEDLPSMENSFRSLKFGYGPPSDPPVDPKPCSNAFPNELPEDLFSAGELDSLLDSKESHSDFQMDEIDPDVIMSSNNSPKEPNENAFELLSTLSPVGSHLSKSSNSSFGSWINPPRKPKKSSCVRKLRWRVEYSKEEIIAIYDGVEMFGERFGNILHYHSNIFHQKRTAISLYDKWRTSLKTSTKEEYLRNHFDSK
ncbi:uncharacterized protein LOC131892922 isoform X2 [Tigriopus californicus]|uniref:uncharacterized protein LOC131892922 isoform X2 n=1 Tax=Tigriopus californicus TaxID=6832 RepID=UPI0027DA85E0|nr:uncharacterized protein LOC131892922 isoform X2 [Tigriopus californicus]